MPPPLIRLALPDEYDAIGHLLVRSYAAIPNMSVSEGLIAELSNVRARAEDCVVLAAADAGEVVGTVTYVPSHVVAAAEFDDPDGAGIRMLAVDPQRRRSGLWLCAHRRVPPPCKGRGQGPPSISTRHSG